ncbi:ABC transporter permease [Cellulomonas humilata]|uniref:ABC transporter permease n=2 Tax=Cellulomonas humilata TaxID=144055 RepID=A0A7Y6A0N8_9CELL|nr:ABC transporter permease [Cellulomonas humilata]
MTAVLDRVEATTAAPPARRPRRRLGDLIVPVFAALAFVYLMVPVAYTVMFSFNDAGKTNLVWRGFTLDNWRNPCGAPQVCEAFANSLQVGVVSTLVATALGTLVAIALVRFRFRGRALTNLLIFLPMSTPEVVLGAALLAQFLTLRVPLGFGTVVAAHVLFCISFVVVTVKARVSSLDPALEEAAADLYASPWQAFWRVTFPLLIPGIAAAALLAFSLSFDDFIVTNFTSGSYTTFPKFVYVSATRGIPPQANVISSFMFVLALAIVVLVQVLGYARSKRLRAPRTTQ